MNKPYLMSLGIGLPFYGVWRHTYIEVRKKHKGSFNKFGLHIVWTTYKRLERV